MARPAPANAVINMSKRSTEPLFRIVSVDKGCRVGILQPSQELATGTPALIMSTRYGHLPHTDNSSLKYLKTYSGSGFVGISGPQISSSKTSMKTICNLGGARKFFNIPDTAIVSTLRDVQNFEFDRTPGRANAAHFTAKNGAKLLTPKELAEVNMALQPCMEFALADETQAHLSKRRAENASKRTAEWLKTYLSIRSSSAPELAKTSTQGQPHPSAQPQLTESQRATLCTSGSAHSSAATHKGTLATDTTPHRKEFDDQTFSEPDVPERMCPVTSRLDLPAPKRTKLASDGTILSGATIEQETRGLGRVVGAVCGHAVPHRGRSVARMIAEHDSSLAGYYIAGRGLGETFEEWQAIVSTVKQDLPPEKPLFISGVKGPQDIIASIKLGFDVIESRYALDATAVGRALVFSYLSGNSASEHSNSLQQPPAAAADESAREHTDVFLELKSSSFKLDESPLVPGCECPTCTTHSRAYIHHLLRTNELLGWSLLEMHNLYHMQKFVSAVRDAISSGNLDALQASLPALDDLPAPIEALPCTAMTDEMLPSFKGDTSLSAELNVISSKVDQTCEVGINV